MRTPPDRLALYLLPLLVTLAVGALSLTLSPPAAAQDNSMPGMTMPATPAAPAGGDAQTAPAAAAPATTGRGLPTSVIIAAILFVILIVLFVLAEVFHWTRPSGAWLGGLALLVAVYGLTDYTVHVQKKPGQSTVWEATTMDMSTMKPLPGAVPVSLEKAESGPFSAKVSYTGTVVALNDEEVYPRVTGRVLSVPVYAGDEVRPGQLVARLDDAELASREREATAATRAAGQNARAAGEEVTAAEAMRQQKASSARAMAVGIDEASRMAQAARAKRTEAEKAVTEARHGATAASKEQSMAAARIASAQAEADAARSGLDNAGADLDSANADLAYWEAEIKR
ncbi:MAG: biotin/lipoyl-binding protein, partial [Armatimonadota bacterium]